MSETMHDFRGARALHLRLGRLGERAALRLYRWRNAQKLAADWRADTHRSSAGELDLVVLDGDVIVFVEVKTRRRADRYAPAANLSPRQRERIRHGAKAYCRIHHVPETMARRFDLVEVIHDGRRLRDVALHEGFMSYDDPADSRERHTLAG